MPDALSPIYGLVEPEHASTAWDSKINNDFEVLDSLIALPHVQRKALTIGATTTLNLTQGVAFLLNLTQDTTIAFSGAAIDTATHKPAQRILLAITADGTARFITWDPSIYWLSGTEPVLPATGTILIEMFTGDNGTTWAAVHVGSLDGLDLNPAAIVSPTYTPSGTTTLDLSVGDVFKFTVATGISTIDLTNADTNTRLVRVIVTNGGLFTLTWDASITWLNGSVPSLRTAGVDVINLFCYNGTDFYGWVADLSAVPRANLAIPQAAKVFLETDTNCTTEQVLHWVATGGFDGTGAEAMFASGSNTKLTVASKPYKRRIMLVAQLSVSNPEDQSLSVKITSGAGPVTVGWKNLSVDDEGTGNLGGQKIQVTAFDEVAAGVSTYYEVRGNTGISEGDHIFRADGNSWFSAVEIS